MKPYGVVIAIVLLICGLAPAQSAIPDSDLHLTASRKDQFYQLRQSIEMCFVLAAMIRDDDNCCYIKDPLPLAERIRLRKCKTESVSITDTSDKFVFDDASIFEGLKAVWISNSDCESTLKALSVNYPEIRVLSISQPQILSV